MNSKILDIYPINYNIGEHYHLKDLYIHFQNKIIKEDKLIIRQYLQVERHIRRGLSFKNSKLYGNNQEITNNNYFSVPLTNMLGEIYYAKIIKKMYTVQDIYEIRIDFKYENHRVLFFCFEKDFGMKRCPFMSLTFGFIKSRDKIDKTQVLTDQSQEIRDKLFGGTFNLEIFEEAL